MMKDDVKKALPKVIGKVFRDISGKGPEKIYVSCIGNNIIVYVTGYITSGLFQSKLLEDTAMKKTLETYYNKLAHNSLTYVQEAVSEYKIEIKSVLTDFDIDSNTGTLMFETNKVIMLDEDMDGISGMYHNFVRNKITEIMRNNTGAYPRSIDIYLSGGYLFIDIKGFLGSFNETKFKFNEELIEANRIFFCGVLKGEINASLDEYAIDGLSFSHAYCDVNILDDYAYVLLKGENDE